MHVYYLISPDSIGLNFNPGVSLISYGCRYLIKQADPEAFFIPISNIGHSDPAWQLLFDQAHCLVLPGGSLYDPSEVQTYWNFDIWDHISKAQSHGIPFADLWGYSSYPYPAKPLHESAAEILLQYRTKRILTVQKETTLFITRDPLTQLIASTSNIPSESLPCASFWSPDFFNIKPSPPLYNCVSVFPIVRDKWFAQALFSIAQHLQKEKPTFLICHTNPEYEWLRSFFPDARNIKCLYDPSSLLDFYSHCDKVVSARLHATIPAFALNCKVIYISFDSRALALDLFHIPSIPYTDLLNGAIPFKYTSLSQTPQPDPRPFIDLFQKKIVSRFKHGTKKNNST